jgi:nucleoside-diphosphate-sugar epimerase
MDVRRSTRDPVYDAQCNILGSLNLILAAVRTGVKRIGTSTKPKYAYDRSCEVGHICLDATRAAQILGWKSSVSFRDGAVKTVDYIRRQARPVA